MFGLVKLQMAVLMLLGTSAASASAIERTRGTAVVASRDNAPAWPAAANTRPRIPRSQTNAARLRRGLPPAKPQKLYRDKKLVGRLVDPPAQASPGPNRNFQFLGCTDELLPVAETELSATDVQDAVNQCSALVSADGFAFGVRIDAGAYICQYEFNGANAVECSATNYALYFDGA